MRSTWSNGEYRWGEAWADLALVKTGFRNAVDDLGWLIQLPAEWTDEHHEIAKAMTGSTTPTEPRT